MAYIRGEGVQESLGAKFSDGKKQAAHYQIYVLFFSGIVSHFFGLLSEVSSSSGLAPRLHATCFPFRIAV